MKITFMWRNQGFPLICSAIPQLSQFHRPGTPNYGPRTKSSPRSHSIWPAKPFHPAAKTFCQ